MYLYIARLKAQQWPMNVHRSLGEQLVIPKSSVVLRSGKQVWKKPVGYLIITKICIKFNEYSSDRS